MSGLLRRIRRGARPTAADPAPETGEARDDGGATAPPDAAAPTGGDAALPAGTDLDRLVGEGPTSRRRSRLRRRLRHLRSVREVLLRDLGGFVFELHRSSGEQSDAETALVSDKLARLQSVDLELRDLEAQLDDRRPMVLREPGIGGTCAVCGELFGSEARFCWACGTPVAPGATRPVSAVAAAAGGSRPAAALPAALAPAAAPEPHIEGTSEELPAAEPTAADEPTAAAAEPPAAEPTPPPEPPGTPYAERHP